MKYDEWILANNALDTVEMEKAWDYQQKRIDKLEKWNREMVEKAAGGGRLDAYREQGKKICELEETCNFWRSTCVDLAASLRGIKNTSVSGIDQYDEMLRVAIERFEK